MKSALGKLNRDKARKPDGIVIDMLVALGYLSTNTITDNYKRIYE